jgi:hypothetical protein
MRRTIGWLTAGWMALAGQAVADSHAVVVELFTSQGCSSCPPADALLAELGQRDDVIPLALHVPYWDYIGWKDVFAAPENESRQRGYARAGGWRMIYTPQIVVMGAEDVVGSRPEQVEALIAQYAKKAPHVDLELARHGDEVHIRVESRDGSPPQPCDIHVVRYAPEAEVRIKRGENAGHTFTYTHIVREWDRTARWDGSGVYEGVVPVPVGEPVVVVVQEPGYGPIVAAARLR